MNFVFITAEVVQHPSLADTIDTFGINKYDLIAQAICFLILAYVLNRFVFRPVIKMSDERRREAEEASANAEKIRKELKETEDARAEILHKAREHAEKIISETKAGADLLGCMIPKRHPYFQILKDLGFLPSLKTFLFMVYRLAKDKVPLTPEAWYVNWGDSDVI